MAETRKVTEDEVKFDVPADWELPDLTSLQPEGGSVASGVRRLVSTYFDCGDGRLRRFGITLRRRVGGGETGWQLKVPNGTARVELQSGSRARQVPPALLTAIGGLRGDDTLQPVATIETTRSAQRVLDGRGELVLEVADDAVTAGPPGGAEVTQWREVEVELGPAGDPSDLAAAGKLLESAGAKPGSARNKLSRALADEQDPTAESADTLGGLVRAYLWRQCDVIACNDVGLRTGERLVHKTRVAVRRTRSTLRIFADLFDPDEAAALDHELSWYADLLGAVRDCDVLERRLADRISQLPAERVLGPVVQDVTATLALRRKEAWERLQEELAGDRYHRLLLRVAGWRAGPPLTDQARSDPQDAGRYVDRADRKAAKRLKKARGDIEELHSARKATKRLRYAAELAKPADGSMKKRARRAEKRQTLLGDHQDAVVAAAFLAQQGAVAGARGANGFTYGLLVAIEEQSAAGIRSRLP